MSKKTFIGRIIFISVLIISTILVLLFVGCRSPETIIKDTGKGAAGAVNGAVDKMTIPGKKNTVTETKEEGDILDKMTNKWIILLTTVTGIVFFCFGGFAMYRMKPILAGTLGATGLAVIAIPVLIVIMWKAAVFLLYCFYAGIIIGMAVGVFILWRKLESKHKGNESFVKFMVLAKENVDLETWKKLKVLADTAKCDEAKKEVDKIRHKMKV